MGLKLFVLNLKFQAPDHRSAPVRSIQMDPTRNFSVVMLPNPAFSNSSTRAIQFHPDSSNEKNVCFQAMQHFLAS